MYFIAEMGLSHLGSVDRAKELIDVARDAGADAVKFQIYTPGHIWSDSSDIDKRQNDQLNTGDYKYLIEVVKHSSLEVGASFFSNYGKELIEHLDFIKIASRSFPGRLVSFSDGERPTYISCGNYLPAKIASGNVTFMACDKTDMPVLSVNAECVIKYLLSAYGRAGYSDHSWHNQAISNCKRAVEAGATVIEKHYCLSRKNLAVDKEHCLEPEELKNLITELRNAPVPDM